jgi:hypothetical protein
MAPRGTLQFRYLSRGAFRLADILAFAFALAAGIYAARKARRPFAIITTALIALPLALTWFLEDARAEVCSSVLAGGVISLAVLLVHARLELARRPRQGVSGDRSGPLHRGSGAAATSGEIAPSPGARAEAGAAAADRGGALTCEPAAFMKPARALRTLHPARVAAAFAVLVGCRGRRGSPSDAGATVRIREIYVPYSELSARAGADPRGIVLTLDEYRKLVLDALRESTPRPSAELPPIEAAITSASYRGRVDGKAARIVGSLRVRLPSAGWVRCDLGEALAGLSSVQVDGQPGWIILVDGPTPGAAQRAHLLLRGAGDHDVRLVFSVAAVESEDRWSVAGALPRAPAALLELEVPGSVDAEADPPFLQVVRESRTSRLILATGSAERFRIAWRRSRTESQVDAVLRAEHRIVFRLARSAPSFAWEAAIGIARRKADSITLREPAGCTVVRVDGERVQAWERTPQGLVVHLADSSASDFRLRLAGLLAPPAGSVTIEPPALVGAVVDAGTIVLEELGDTRVVVASTTEIDEVSAREASLPGEEAAPELPIGSRCFRYRSAAARLTARLEERAARPGMPRGRSASHQRDPGPTRSDFPRHGGRRSRLGVAVHVPRAVEVAGPDGSLRPRRGPSVRPLRHQEAQMNGVRSLAVELEHAVEPGKPLEIRATFEHVGFEGERGWERKEFDAELPAIDCDRSRTDLGLFLDASMDALLSGLPGWRTLDEAEGVKENLAGRGGCPPRGLLSRRPSPAPHGLADPSAAQRRVSNGDARPCARKQHPRAR